MDIERSKELCHHLRTTLNLSFAFPELEKDPEFYDKIYNGLKPLHSKLCEALENAYPYENNLRVLVKQEWDSDLSEIPNGNSYADKLRNTIEWMESEGCLLEFIAVAHLHRPHNIKLNYFMRVPFLQLLQPLGPPQQIPLAELQRPTLQSPTQDVDVGNNGHDSKIRKGEGISELQLLPKIADISPPSESEGQKYSIQPTPFPRPKFALPDQSHEETITSAQGRIRTTREKIQSVYDIFQAGEKISEPHIAELITQAKASIDGISNLFIAVPTPDYLELDYRFACEEKYAYEKISIIAAYSLRDEYIRSRSVFQGADKEFHNIFTSLQNLDNFINTFQEQIQLSASTNDPLPGNDVETHA